MNETNFQKEFIEKAKTFLKKCTLIHSEYPLYKAEELLKREFYEKSKGKNRSVLCGRIDLIFKYKGILYGCEIKMSPFSSCDFWDALKIIGYCAYYNWQNSLEKKEVLHPAIMIPLENIKLEHKIVANKLNIGLFGIDILGESLAVIPIRLKGKKFV